jgi:hypothetical protein
VRLQRLLAQQRELEPLRGTAADPLEPSASRRSQLDRVVLGAQQAQAGELDRSSISRPSSATSPASSSARRCASAASGRPSSAS